MSKPVKNLMTKSYERRFADVAGAVVINISGSTRVRTSRCAPAWLRAASR